VAVVDAMGEVAQAQPRTMKPAVVDLLLRLGQPAAAKAGDLEGLSRLDALRVRLDTDDEVTGNLAQP
jgi:hypothetical protein